MPTGAKLMGTWLTPTERSHGPMLLDGRAPLRTAFGAIILASLIAFFDSWRMAFVFAGIGTILTGFCLVAYPYIPKRTF